MKHKNILVGLAAVMLLTGLSGCTKANPAGASPYESGDVSTSPEQSLNQTSPATPTPVPAVSPTDDVTPTPPVYEENPQQINNGIYSYILYSDHAEITYYYDTSVTDLTIPESLDGVPVTKIGEWAFANHNEICSLTIPHSVTCIGSNAFYHCMKLEAVRIPDSVREIGAQVFDCTEWFDEVLTEEFVIVGDGVLIKYNGYGGDVAIPSNVKCISSPFINMAWAANRITSVTIPYGVHTLSDYAFENCRSITSITIPDSVTKIGQGTFMYCTSLQQITYSGALTYIPQYAFFGCTSLNSFYVSDRITAIGKDSFGGCTALTGMTIPSNVTSIDPDAFRGTEETFTICCTAGSYAEQYAASQQIGYSVGN